LGKNHWLFKRAQLAGERLSIVYLNVGDTDATLLRLILSMGIVGICVLTLFYLISQAFANRAMRPAAESFEKQRRFVADASHELKTPIAIIDANAEAAQADPDEAKFFLARIEAESGRMHRLIEDLLYLARAEDSADGARDALPTDLSAAVEEEIGRIEAVLFECGVGLEFRRSKTQGPLVRCDGQRIRQAILILLDNAVKYTNEGGTVVAETGSRLRGAGRQGFFRVSNTGDGISPDDLPHIFDRFYRADKSRSSAGYGLGLSIAKTIVDRSGGRISCVSADGLTTFTIELPLA
ncbi:MAG: HAMP domain-containing histidine kinase, partial [Clostridiales Family XIII bacterium]|nr:HAMP domain-containing histidine kinase [Clostridiales Family XIII bacterium]